MEEDHCGPLSCDAKGIFKPSAHMSGTPDGKAVCGITEGEGL